MSPTHGSAEQQSPTRLKRVNVHPDFTIPDEAASGWIGAGRLRTVEYHQGMELDLEGRDAGRAYPVLASLVIPRPIALVTTLTAEKVVNAAPFSFFNVLGASPPIVAFAPGDREDGTPKDTARNVRLGHEFVVNLFEMVRPS